MRHVSTLAFVLVLVGCGAGSGAPSVNGSSSGGWGEPRSTFTLPEPAPGAGKPALYHPELAKEFTDVDWSTLDRLYIPAGEYRTILLGGLPARSADRPLVITNLGGQVKVGGEGANYVFVIKGGKNWVLTGRNDPTSKTGDASFRGHAEGAFAHSQGTYGIVIDDAFSKAGLSGLAVGGGASDFELDMLEVTRAEFAGLVVKTDDDGSATMRNVRIHDLYVHDVGSEGIYLGSTQPQPQHAFEALQMFPSVVAENNPSAPVAPVRFRDFMGAYLDEDYRRIEWWTARATLSPDQRAVVYPAGALALQGGTIYEALAENQEKEPAANPDVWRALPAPADDVRLAPGSPHAGLGVRWPPPAR